MIPYQEPERPAMLDMKKLRMDHAWVKNQIGDVTYLRSLFFLGYSSNDAIVELNLLKLEKEEIQRVRLAKFSTAK